jgi:hypothetical protein
MGGTHGCWQKAAVLLLALLAPRVALAGPYIGEWSWGWHPGPDCPRGDYCPLHYWAPDLYKVRAWVHPSFLDQYPPGPCPPVPPSFIGQKFPCQTTAPMPTIPYADPAGYYGIR